jgi:hypothetical protein
LIIATQHKVKNYHFFRILFKFCRNPAITVLFISVFLILGSDGKDERPAEEGAAVSFPGGDILEQLHPVVPGRGHEVCCKLVFRANSLSILFIAWYCILLSGFWLNAD